MDANDNDDKYGDGRISTGNEAPPRLPPRPHRTHRPQRQLLNNNTIHHAVPPPVPPLPMATMAPAVPSALVARGPPLETGVTFERTGQLPSRRENLYVDTPRRTSATTTASIHKTAKTTNTTTRTKQQMSATLARDRKTVTSNLRTPKTNNVISRQPQSEPLKNNDNLITNNSQDEHQDSVICLKCRKCKCSSCTEARPLPSRWICGHIVSVDSVVETCTCYCCVKGLFYHMFKDKEVDDKGISMEDGACSCCEQRHCCQRWCCIGLMSVCLPCLCCYPPLKGIVNLIHTCYNHCNRPGCTCSRQRRHSQTKRFLLDSSDASSC